MSPWCHACSHDVDQWAPGPGGRPGARCPHCQSLERHRFLALILERLGPVIDTSRWVLDVAPQPQIQRILESRIGHRYIGVDRFPGLDVDVLSDLQMLPFRSEAFGLAVCYHVLEHVRNDGAAMAELARVLEPSGFAIIQVPRRPTAPTVEDPDAPPEERIERFGQEDHVRYYGRDFEDRLRARGLHPSVIVPSSLFDPAEMERFGFADEEVWFCAPEPLPADGDGAEPRQWLERTTRWVLEERADQPSPPEPRSKPRRRPSFLGRVVRYIRHRFG